MTAGRETEPTGDRARDQQLTAAGLPAADSVTPLVFNPNNPVTSVVERIALADGSAVIRKVICRDRPTTVPHWPAGAEASHWNHWRREVHAYDERVVDAFATSGLRSPGLLGRTTPADGVEVLLLEVADGRSGADLGAADLAEVAARLGHAQGGRSSDPEGGLADRHSDWPDHAWLSRDWMWAYALSRPPGPDGYADAAAWEHPVVVAGFGEARHRLRSRFGELLAQTGHWRALTGSLPHALAHLDCWANNVVLPDVGDPVLLDWSNVGLGTLGEDPANLVLAGLLDHHLAPETHASLDEQVWGAYSRGLVAAGWRHPLELARIGMGAATMKFVWLPALMVRNAGFSGPTGYGARQGLDLVEVFRRRAVVFEGMLDRLDDTRRLADQLHLWS